MVSLDLDRWRVSIFSITFFLNMLSTFLYLILTYSRLAETVFSMESNWSNEKYCAGKSNRPLRVVRRVLPIIPGKLRLFIPLANKNVVMQKCCKENISTDF